MPSFFFKEKEKKYYSKEEIRKNKIRNQQGEKLVSKSRV